MAADATAATVEAVLGYTSRGWAVFPVRYRSKEPDCPNGFKDAVTDGGAAAEYFGSRLSNVGVATGAASGGLLVIDLDDHGGGESGMDRLSEWEREHGPLPDTAMAETGSGGTHLLYRYDPSERAVRCSVGRGEWEGVDVRADGGYIVAPPSVHPNGRPYAWDAHPDDVEPAEADERVWEFLDAVQGPRGSLEGDRYEIPESIPLGRRNDELARYAGLLRNHGMVEADILAQLRTFNEQKCDPPVPERELAKIARSIGGYPPGKSERAGAAEGQPQQREAQHVEMARKAMDEDGACLVDGMPAVRSGSSYEVGWDAVQRAVIRRFPTVRQTARREVCEYLRLMAPRVEQADARYVAFSNGVLDVETMGFPTVGDVGVIANVVPHRWDPAASFPAVDSVLSRMACGDPVTLNNLEEVLGLCLYRSNRFALCPVLLGAGSNGKSTYIDMIQRLLGEGNVSAMELGMVGERFMAAELMGKLANLGDDIPTDFVSARSLAVFKKVVGGSEVFSDVKGVSGVSFRPYCTMVFSANEMPRLGDATEGVMRRMFPIEFNARFSPEDADFDPFIGDKLATEGACERMAVLAVRGLRRVLRMRAMTPNARSRAMVEGMRTDNDAVLQWMEDTGTTLDDVCGERTTAQIYAGYADWARESGCKAASKATFSRRLARMGVETRTVRRGGAVSRCYVLRE